MSTTCDGSSCLSVEGDSFPDLSHPDWPDSCSADDVGTCIGSYRLIKVLGEGGFGTVYLAEQDSLVGRRVALKVMKLCMDARQVAARFEVERQALACLDHPNIARVYDSGTTDDGRPYFVMEYVNGPTITEYCDRERLAIGDRLRLMAPICEAVHYAHQRGIIHRDLKPSNILVRAGQNGATPIIIDFGIAKATSQASTDWTVITNLGQFVGTPAYMSPEQAEMTGAVVDVRSDVYSLGVLLYEVLTGRLPLDAANPGKIPLDEMLRMVREEDAPRPSACMLRLGDKAERICRCRSTEARKLAKRLKRELEWIPLKAIRKEPDQRYQSAADLAEDIRNYLNGVPLLAGPPSLAYYLDKLIKRHLKMVIVTEIFVVILLTCITVPFLFVHRASGMVQIYGKRAVRAEARVAELEAKVAVAEEQLEAAQEILERVFRPRAIVGADAQDPAAGSSKTTTETEQPQP